MTGSQIKYDAFKHFHNRNSDRTILTILLLLKYTSKKISSFLQRGKNNDVSMCGKNKEKKESLNDKIFICLDF